MIQTLTMMLVVGLILSFAILAMFIWGAKQGQFDDDKKMMNGLLFDTQEDLNDAIQKENKKQNRKQKLQNTKENLS
jgi:cbb3-type cytochrome oxidase maturation protein